MTEHEKKMLLTKEEYESFLDFFGCKEFSEQINYYFDTEDLSMNMQDITCRIRFKDGQYQGTLKQHLSNESKSEETEIDIQNGIYDNEFVRRGLTLQGVLTTKRYVVWKIFGCEIVLDKNEYLGHTDYELEIEYLPKYEKEANFLFHFLRSILDRHDRCRRIQEYTVPSKSSRFFKYKSK